jgi:Ricin-type beta-trefoil lectin domain-like
MFKLQVQSSDQYLNILGGSQENGAEACQGNTPTTDNFLWQFIPVEDNHFKLRVKHSGQYLNILNGSEENGAEACQGNTPTTPNFFWRVVPA